MTNSIYEKLVESLIRPEILALSAYNVPESMGMIKLDAMENPYLWPDELVAEWQALLQHAELNRYPDAQATDLCSVIRSVMNVPKECDVMLGNGSDELIQILAMALAKPGAKMLSFEPSFVMYRLIAQYVNMEYIGVPLNSEDFSIDLEQTLLTIRQHQPELIFIAYPNNPTGNVFDPIHLDQIIQESNGLVVIDEAYQPFADDSFISRLNRYPNVVIMRTVSKLGLAGLRLGYLVGAKHWVHQLNKIRLPYNINVLTQVSAEFALQHHDVFLAQAKKIKTERHLLTNQLERLLNVQVFPSRANFILFKLHNRDATDVFEGLKNKGILIKNLSASGGALSNCLRVTVGKPSENKQFLDALSFLIK